MIDDINKCFKPFLGQEGEPELTEKITLINLLHQLPQHRLNSKCLFATEICNPIL